MPPPGAVVNYFKHSRAIAKVSGIIASAFILTYLVFYWFVLIQNWFKSIGHSISLIQIGLIENLSEHIILVLNLTGFFAVMLLVNQPFRSSIFQFEQNRIPSKFIYMNH